MDLIPPKADHLLLHPSYTEMQIRAKALAFDALFNNIPMSFYWIDRQGKMLGCSDYVFEVLKLPPEQVIGQDVYKITSQEAWHNSQQVMDKKETMITEEIHNQGQSDEIIFLTIKSPVLDDQNNVTGLIGASVNITNMKKQEQIILEAKDATQRTNELKMAFIHNMQHDIRTPCSGIYGVANLLAEKEINNTDQELVGLLNMLATASKRLMDYCDVIVDFRGLSSGELPLRHELFDAQELLTSVVELELPAAAQKKVKVESYYEEKLPKMLISDPHRLQRILINLVSNAIKFTAAGTVKISMSVARSIDQANLLLQLNVVDTGIGIPSGKQDIIFERFVRLEPANMENYSGHGLGLSIVKQFVTELKGTIKIDSIPNQGTTISCFIPVQVVLF